MNNNPKRIYIADDETNIRSAIKTFLENAGYSVTDFENGDLLLDAFAEKPADLVVLDVMMPGSNGFVVCKELRKTSTVPIIMLTARDSDLDYATGLDIGSDDYLVKPFSPMALVMRIKAIFRRMEYDKKVYAEQDMLTGLLDKISGINLIQNKLMTSAEKSQHALYVVDIDNFKNINDNLGHSEGDKVLIDTAGALTELFRDSDIVSRFGGDEFIVLATDIKDAVFVEKRAKEICSALRKNYGEGENIHSISASIGISLYPTHATTYEDLFDLADKAMYKTKGNSRDGYTLHEE
ncbi:MAG: diguanylate cyclase [Defluviitaleaceae bacterium]|nr:diguanylate cyclase [Defluviitaleaceae bacterium]